ncbi:MAG: tetratricopeptide repeat protein [Flavobacteriales bacterium]|nr:tetratricopeptide repeat protein [Flavobacteriales bacterium]
MNRLLLPFLLAVSSFTAQGQGSAQEHLAAARSAYDAGRYTDALSLADSAIAHDQALAAAYKLRGDVHQRNKEMERAMADYGQAERLDPVDARLYVSRSAARITGGNLKGAQKDLDRALSLTPNDPDIYYNRACVFYLMGDNKSALKDTERALKLDKGHAEALFLSGTVKGEEYREKEGLAEIEEALRLKPDLPGGQMSAAVLLYELKAFEEAIVKFTEIIDTDSTLRAEAHYYRGDCRYNLDQKEQACSDWRQASALGDREATFIVKNYCETDRKSIPKKPVRKRRTTVVSF